MIFRFLLPAVGGALLLAPILLLAQGDITPPGAPGRTMKRLDEVEARTIVNVANCPPAGSYAYTIAPAQFANGGSFYLTGNLIIPAGSGGVLISASNVTLDLNGFAIVSGGSATSLAGVSISGTNVTVTGGTVSGAGFALGVASAAANTRVNGLSVSGATNGGIALTGPGGVVQASTVNGTGGVGIQGDAVSDSTATATASTAILAKTASNVSGSSLGSGAPVIVTDPQNLDGGDVRRPVSAVNTPGDSTAAFVISQAGSYYLTGNVPVTGTGGVIEGIKIAADNVTLDLNGFTISSSSATPAGHGVYLVGGRSMVAISNGHIRSGSTASGTTISNGPGFLSGIDYSGTPLNVRVSGVSVAGVKSWGIDLGADPASTVQACVVRIAGIIGIHAGAVSDSSATQCLGSAISATTVSNCVGSLLTGGTGVNNPTVAADLRIPISAATTISTPGSYYLANSIAVTSGNAITVAADDVQIDLNGFTLFSSSSSASGAGIAVTGNHTGLRVRNGFIKGLATYNGNTGTYAGGGFLNGIDARTMANALVEKVAVDNVTGTGIQLYPSYAGFAALDPGGIARDCTTNVTGIYGISASVVTSCYAYQSGLSAIVSRNVSHSVGSTSSSSSTTSSGDPYVTQVAGILSFGVVNDSVGQGSGAAGIFASYSANACWGYSLAGIGIKCYVGPATNCCGTSVFGPASIDSPSVSSCVGQGAAISSPNKYNTP